jgi:rhamnopyranosyl-N-acetylglucosaminyl-diphospho-decaprenol beta-1,3/1,4-galactofuranosyltransferase
MTGAAKGTRAMAVVVSYNRRALLRESLEAIRAQTAAPVGIIVVDNGSTDGSADLVAEHFPEVDLVRLRDNSGGAGGFAVGIARALEQDPDWIWLMDDDTVPTPTALAELLGAVRRYPAVPTVLGSRVVWTDGTDHPMNTPRPKFLARRTERSKAAAAGAVPVRSSSFVSMLVAAEAVRAHGLPVVDYFIWNDDFEYSTRLIRSGRGLYVPSSVVVHKTARLVSTDDDPGERFYYEVRNKVWMLRNSRSLSPAEKLLYGASSLRRWGRTFRRSTRPSVLRTALVRGLRDGFAHPPRSNSDSMRAAGAEISALLARAEAKAARGG